MEEATKNQFLKELAGAKCVTVYFCPLLKHTAKVPTPDPAIPQEEEIKPDPPLTKEEDEKFLGLEEEDGDHILDATVQLLGEPLAEDQKAAIREHFNCLLEPLDNRTFEAIHGYRCFVARPNDFSALQWSKVRALAVDHRLSFGLWLNKRGGISTIKNDASTLATPELNVMLTFRNSGDGWRSLLSYVALYARVVRQHAMLIILKTGVKDRANDRAWSLSFEPYGDLPEDWQLLGGEVQPPPPVFSDVEELGEMRTWEVESDDKSWPALMVEFINALRWKRPTVSCVQKIVASDLLASRHGKGATFEHFGKSLRVRLAGRPRFLFVPACWNPKNAAAHDALQELLSAPELDSLEGVTTFLELGYLIQRSGAGRGVIMKYCTPRKGLLAWPPPYLPDGYRGFFDM